MSNACWTGISDRYCETKVVVLAVGFLILAQMPAVRAQRPRLNLLENPGFEAVTDGEPDHWRIADSMSSISTERCRGGKHALKIADSDPTTGSSVYSASHSVIPRRDYFVRGWAYLESGNANGLGVYVQFLDPQGKAIRDAEDRQQTCRPTLVAGRWIQFFQPMTVPAGAASLRVWIHTFNAAVCVVYVDDLELLECFENVFGDALNWEGGSPDHLLTRQADYSVRWAHADTPSLTRDCSVHAVDWSGHTGVSFWLHANQATGNAFMFIIVSENPITLGMDYWSAKITANWTGWKQFVFAFRELKKSRKPLGFDKISKIYFTATGWGNAPNPDLVIHLEELKPVNVSH